MRVSKIRVSDAFLHRVFTAGEDLVRVCRDGLPATATLRLVRHIGSGRHVTIEFLYEDASFPELPENREMWDCPEINPVYTTEPLSDG